MKNTLERRLKLLKMEGIGFSQSEIGTTLSEDFHVTKRTIRRDFQLRHEWQPLLQEMDPQKSLLKTLNRYEQVYRKASMIVLQTQNDSAKVGALKVMLDASKASLEITAPEERREEMYKDMQKEKEYYYDWDKATKEEQEIMLKGSRIMTRIRTEGPRPKVRLH